MSRVAVVLPTYNRASLLARAVRSVLQQTFADWELWIIDDGSTDDTRAAIEPFLRDPRVLYRYQDNGGVSRARNHAIFATSAPYVAFLDSDDEWKPVKLSRQIQYLNENPSFRLVHCEETWIRNGVEVKPLKKHAKAGAGRVFLKCLPLCCISPSTAMAETALIRSLGGFREDFPVCEDYDLWLKISAQEDVGFISEPMILKYGGHEDQLSLRRGLDEYRTRALWEIRNHTSLSLIEKQAAREEFERKRSILIRGFEKHGHAEKSQYWRSLDQS